MTLRVGGIEGAEPQHVAKRIEKALETLDREHDRVDALLKKLERGRA